MNLITMLEDYWNRIPQSTVSFMLAALTFRIYLYFLKDKILKQVLVDKFWSCFFIFLTITRFSGQILHPTNLLGMNIYRILSGPPANGWVLGLLVSSIYAAWALHKERVINAKTLYLMTIGVLFASLPAFLYRMRFDLNPFFLQDTLRLGLAIFLLLANSAKWSRIVFRKAPQRLWLAMGVFLLGTSVLTPQLDKWMVFSAAQWVEILLILLALL